MPSLSAFVVLLSFLAVQTVTAAPLRCDVETKYWCSPEGCEVAGGVGDFVVIDLDAESYSLCTIGKSDCQVLQITRGERSGIFYSVAFGGNGFLKFATTTEPTTGTRAGQVIEVCDRLIGSMMSFGSCK